jgi:halimadienyl-diphosphate synthase
MNILQSCSQLLKNLTAGQMANTVYDTAWVARLGELDKQMGEDALNWICKNQLDDGSWGTKAPFYYHDRVICTLAAMTALAQKGRRAQDHEQIQLGKMALEKIAGGATKGLSLDPAGPTVGFEMIAPTLLAEAEALGAIKNQGQHILGRLASQRAAKMALLKGRMINRFITVAFSAEMAGSDGSRLLDVENLQEANGSIGHSPSATAYYLINVHPQNDEALKYLRGIVTMKGVPDLTPFELFERVWVLWNLAQAGPLNKELLTLCQTHLDYIQAAWTPGEGIGFSTGYTPKDADNTIVGYDLLLRFGRQADLSAVLSYEEDQFFRCYPFESHPSIGVNIHALSALRQGGFGIEYPSIQKIIRFLRQTQMENAYWFDKWHVSPYYATSHAILASAGYANDLVANSIDWMLTTQNKNGSWGYYLPTVEETAYCLQALITWKQHGGRIEDDKLKLGINWLVNHLELPRPALWIGKCLYYPEFIVESAILSALILTDKSYNI